MSSEGKKQENLKDCPLDKNELGRSTWGLLHTSAAYFPDTPTENHKQAAKNLVNGIKELYSCKYCAKDFQKEVRENPPKVDSREEFSIWLCLQHNTVNRKIGKPEFSCDIEALDKRWKYGHKGCFKT
mmetsp:Transcript_18531/g.26123  ORF Transcript_18531/g.26123 Transcript_18531/m.26123 type:complete len:127 (-) Transcript_18531:18-398(-)